jgi:hypothetical protein
MSLRDALAESSPDGTSEIRKSSRQAIDAAQEVQVERVDAALAPERVEVVLVRVRVLRGILVLSLVVGHRLPGEYDARSLPRREILPARTTETKGAT